MKGSVGLALSNGYSFKDIPQNKFCNFAKISHPADLEIW